MYMDYDPSYHWSTSDPMHDHVPTPSDTVGRVLIAQFNNYVLVKSGKIANPVIAMDDPVPYCISLCLQIY